MLASIDGDGELELWDVATGRRRLSIVMGDPDGRRIEGMAFAPDGRTIAARSSSATICYDAANGRPIRRLEEQSQRHKGKAQPFGLAFSPDGSFLAASFSTRRWSCGGSGRGGGSARSTPIQGPLESGLHARRNDLGLGPCQFVWTRVPGRSVRQPGAEPHPDLGRRGGSRDSPDRAGQDDRR